MGKIYMLTNVLPTKYGGRTKVIFERANMLVKEGYEVEILFADLDVRLEEKFKGLYKNGTVDKRVKMVSMLNDLRRKSIGTRYRKQTKNYKSKYAPKVIFFEDSFKIKEMRYYYPDEKRYLFRDYLSRNKRLLNRVYYDQPGVKTREVYYNNNKSEMLLINGFDNDFEVSGKYQKGKYLPIHFNNINELVSHWLESYIGDESCTLIVDARRRDEAFLLANLPNCKIIPVIHGNHANTRNELKYFFNNLLTEQEKSFNIVSLTYEQKADIETRDEYGGQAIDVIPHYYSKKDIKYRGGEKKIIIIAKIIKRKRVPMSIRAFDIISKKYPEYTLGIYGNGDDLKRTKDIAEEIGNPKVRFHPYESDVSKINELYQRADCLLISSFQEGFGLTIGEAISNGCPVVTTPFKYGARDQVVEGTNGSISKRNTPESLAMALENVITTKYDRDQVASSINQFSFENYKEKWIDIIEKTQ